LRENGQDQRTVIKILKYDGGTLQERYTPSIGAADICRLQVVRGVKT